LKAKPRAQSPFNGPAANADGFVVDLAIPPNLFLLVARTALRILAQCRKKSFSKASLTSAQAIGFVLNGTVAQTFGANTFPSA
jgi:hypothetical protein